MNADENSLLLAFTGADTSLPVLSYGLWLAAQIHLPVTLLEIVENPVRQQKVKEALQAAEANLEAAGIPFRTLVESGNSGEVICRPAAAGRHLTIFGSFDRPLLRRWLRGRSFRRIFQKIETLVLYVREMHPQLQNILVCMGGLGHASNAERWALFLAQRLGAKVTILYVVEPISYDHPTACKIQDHWENFIETNTHQGKNLRAAFKTAEDMGVSANFQVRHGDIVHEISEEINTQKYDLIVMGSPFSSDNLRHLFMPRITAEIAENAQCPVLAASLGQEWIFTDQ